MANPPPRPAARAAGTKPMVDVPAYLRRIGYSGSLEPNAETLRALHRAHMLAVPFENLDISGGRRRLHVDVDAFFAKIVGERRGGLPAAMQQHHQWRARRWRIGRNVNEHG